MQGLEGEVTCLEISKLPNTTILSVGYQKGKVRLYNLDDFSVITTLDAHARAVSAIAWLSQEKTFATGSRDTDIVVWDGLEEKAQFRLQGHKDQVTCVRFVDKQSLVSASKDTLIKVWDLDTQYCTHTLTAHKSAVWSFDLNVTKDVIVVGGSSGTLSSLYKVDERVLREEKALRDEAESGVVVEQGVRALGAPWRVQSGPMNRQTNERVHSVQYSEEGDLLVRD